MDDETELVWPVTWTTKDQLEQRYVQIANVTEDPEPVERCVEWLPFAWLWVE